MSENQENKNDCGKKSGGLCTSGNWILSVLALVALIVFFGVIIISLRDPLIQATGDLAINVALLAAAIFAVFAVAFGFLVFTQRREMQEEYKEMCIIREKAQEYLDSIRDQKIQAEERLKDVHNLINKMFDKHMRESEEKLIEQEKHVHDQIEEMFKKHMKEAEEAQKKRIQVVQSFHEGLKALENKEYDLAIRHYDRCLENDPENAAAFGNRGLAKAEKEDYDEAIKDYDRAIEIDPNYAAAFNNRGIAKADKGDYDEAIKDYDRAIEIDPKYAAAYKNLVWLLTTCADEKHRNPKRAVELAEKAVELTDRKKHGFLDTLAAAYAADGRFEDAVKTEEEAIGLLGPEEKDARVDYENKLELYKKQQPYIDES